MINSTPDISRHKKRKEARLEKNQRKHQSWLQRQQSQKSKRESQDSIEVANAREPENLVEESVVVKKDSDSSARKMVKREKRSKKTKFEEFLELEKPTPVLSAEADMELERRLAKKLKVKDDKLRGEDDGMNVFMEGIPSLLDSLDMEFSGSRKKIKKKKKEKKVLEQKLEDEMVFDEDDDNGTVDVEEVIDLKEPKRRKRKRKLSLEERDISSQEDSPDSDDVTPPAETDEEDAKVVEVRSPADKPEQQKEAKYIAPRLRARAGNEPEEHIQLRKRVRGLLNREFTESKLESIAREMSTVYNSVARSVASQILSEGILAAYSNGLPRTEQDAAVFASFVAGMSCLVGIDFSAKLLASFAISFEDEYRKEDTDSLGNLTLLLAYLCIFGVCSSDLIYDFLSTLSKRLTEIDVSTILKVLKCCGMKLRGDDPLAMRNFILSVQNRVSELKAASADGNTKIDITKMEFMLKTIFDIKNNKMSSKDDLVQHTRIKKWLQKLRVEDVLIRGLKWSKLLETEKKGQWWLSGDIAEAADVLGDVSRTIDKEVLESQKMLQLATSQRMNTDGRKAVFCVIMSGEDYIDAFEKLLRLDLPGKQDREIMRVLVECCLQEKVFNKYYTALASKLCEHDKNHKFTLQYCLWDHLKELEKMPLFRSINLAKFTAEMIASFTLSLAVLKCIDFIDPVQLTPKRIMHLRILLEAIFEYPDKVVWNMFTRITVDPNYEDLRNGIKFFVKEHVMKTNKAIVNKFKIAKKALGNAKGSLM